MANGDHVAVPNEQVGLTEGYAPIGHLGRPGNHE
jgi:hypothetical protein